MHVHVHVCTHVYIYLVHVHVLYTCTSAYVMLCTCTCVCELIHVCTFLSTDPTVPGEHRSLHTHTRLGDSVCLQTSSQLYHSMCVEGPLIWTAVQPLQSRYTCPGTPAFNVHIVNIVHVLHYLNMPVHTTYVYILYMYMYVYVYSVCMHMYSYMYVYL